MLTLKCYFSGDFKVQNKRPSRLIFNSMTVELVSSNVVPMFKSKDDIRNSRSCRAKIFLVHGMKVVKRVLEKTASWISDC